MKVEIDGKLYVPAPVPAEGESLDAALDLRIESCDAGDQITVREYLRELLATLWRERECFSGKRPFGNSGWDYDLLYPLAKGGFIDLGEPFIEDGHHHYDDATSDQLKSGRKYVEELIKRVFES